MRAARAESISLLAALDGRLCGTKIPRFWRTHLVFPVVAATIALLWLELADGNRLIADQLYVWEGGQWLLRDHRITSNWIHHGGKQLSLALWVMALMLRLRIRDASAFANWRRPLTYLLLATLAATMLVSGLQMLTSMDCPWDMQGYGGLRPYIALFDVRPDGLKSAACFPAGHASAGYCWVALYFFFAALVPRWRWRGLAFGLGLGAVFGLSQQLRGAHFLSHDVMTLLICWLTALASYVLMCAQRRTAQ